jgi:hypothetical protein
MSIVFHASKPPATIFPTTWAPLEHLCEDDELVYPIRTVRQTPKFSLPALRGVNWTPGRKSLHFELLLRSVFGVGLLDSGATHSFVTKSFCKQNSIGYTSARTQAMLADGNTALPVVGVCWNAELKLHHFSCKQSFLVLDSNFTDSSDVVLGMDWLDEHDPFISFRKRNMTLPSGQGPVTIPAIPHEPDPSFSSDFIELCSLDAFARSLRDDSAVDDSDVIVAVLQHAPPEPQPKGLGAELPEIQPLLTEFADVLVSEIPGGLPPERFARDGSRIECKIDLAPDAKPFARPPRTFAPEELAAIRKYIDEFLSKGWIGPSLGLCQS